MNVTVLMQKLIAIEQAVGVETNKTIRSMIQDAQECLLELQKDWLELPFKSQTEQKNSRKPN